MAVNEYKFGAKIVVSSTLSYHTYSDWGLIITNGDPVGDPEQETEYLTVPGRSNLLDWSEALSGGVVFKGRQISMDVVMTCAPEEWSTQVSTIRNAIEGRQVKIYFDDDPSHYWLGRINVKETERVKRLGKFKLTAYVDAYKHDKNSSQERLRWDDMNFLTDCLRYLGVVQITDSGTITIPHGNMETVPTIRVTNMTSGSFTMHASSTGRTYTLTTGTQRFPDLKVCGASDVTLTFAGSAKVTITYRGGSL